MIAVFSGTGNSMAVALRLASLLGDEVAVMPDARLDADDRIIWVFPVYSWGVPPVVVDYIRGVSAGEMSRCDHYAVMTCGDDTGHTDRMWRREIRRAGGRARGVWSVQMPNTYVLMKGFDVDSAGLERAKLAAMPDRVEAIAAAIKSSPDETDVVKGSFATIKTGVIYPWFKRHAMSPKPFHALESCVGCGQCARQCPLGNITMQGGRPAWGDRCALCLRCYHLCPRHSVAYGKATDGKGQYRSLLKIFDR
ncbi:MAG: EFR1 family ferrodoxin [Bacteroidales bacterium]|nr:EFR1 family ferrodoxin [Bacteroidales bacterium]